MPRLIMYVGMRGAPIPRGRPIMNWMKSKPEPLVAGVDDAGSRQGELGRVQGCSHHRPDPTQMGMVLKPSQKVSIFDLSGFTVKLLIISFIYNYMYRYILCFNKIFHKLFSVSNY